MNKTIVTTLVIIAFASGFLIFYLGRSTRLETPGIEQSQQTADVAPSWESKTDDQFSLTITVTPIELSAQAQEWKFNVIMNTHSVELDQDMIKIATLVDDSGKKHKPLRWEGASAGGHHREGMLIFSSVTPAPRSVELKISIGNVIRSFAWQL